MKKYMILVIMILVSGLASAQDNSGGFNLLISDENHRPLEGASVELRRTKDSLLVRTEITDKQGIALFEKVKQGDYFIKASFLGYSTVVSKPISIAAGSNERLSDIELSKSDKSLKEVVVSTKKPFLQKLTDRIIVNVDNSIVNAGSSAMDVLERSPGVLVDQNDAISLRGRQGVVIMIDGKPTAMAGADLAHYLRGLPSAAIERIEIITNPSAKYEAAGNSGIIDIRMKKDLRYGTNGNVSMGYGQGVYPKANAGINLNHRNKKLNIFGNYNYGYRINLNHLLLDRNFYENGSFNGQDLKDNYMKAPYGAHTTRFGMDFSPSRKTIIGFVVNANITDVKRTNDNSSIVIDAQKQTMFTFNTAAKGNDQFNNMVGNINFKHTFDSTGRELTADADYGKYNSESFSTTATKYYSLNGGIYQPDYVLTGSQDGDLSIRSGKIDFVNPLPGQAKLELGVKSSLVSSDNDVRFFDISNGAPVNDVDKTNRFYYNEYNHAGYLNFSKEWKKFSVQLGLRGEYTKVNTLQARNNISFDTNYFQLFPSTFLNYKLTPEKTLGLSVSRRIDRPGYHQLNPFLFLIDVSTYSTGSPGLLPQLTWSYELSYTMKQMSFTLGYSHTKDNQSTVIARFKDVFPNIPQEDNVTVQIPVNLESSDYFGLTIAAPVRINKWWNMINNGNIYYIHYNGNLANTPLSNGTPAATLNTNNTFTLGKGWTSELGFSYNSKVRSGYMVFDPQWGLSAGVQKLVMKNKGTIRFNMTDIFWTNLPKAVITYNNYVEKWRAYRESRVANISFNYRFGSNKIAAARRRTTASEEERRRAG